MAYEKGYPYFTILNGQRGVDTTTETGLFMLPQTTTGHVNSQYYAVKSGPGLGGTSYSGFGSTTYSSTTNVPVTFQYDAKHPYQYVYVMLLNKSDLNNHMAYYVTNDYYSKEIEQQESNQHIFHALGWIGLTVLIVGGVVLSAMAEAESHKYDYSYYHYYPY